MGTVAENRAVCRALGVRRRIFDHVLGEANVEHLVGFVEDREPDLREVDGAASQVVDDPARGADNYMGASIKGSELPCNGFAAVDWNDVNTGVGGKPVDLSGDLEGELAGGDQDEALYTVEVRVNGLDHGKAEGGSLAASGLCLPDQVFPFEENRRCLFLNGGGTGVFHLG